MIIKASFVISAAVLLLAYASGAAQPGETRKPANGGAAGNGNVHEIADLKMTLIRIEPGEFLMGSPPDEPGRNDNEQQHRVRLTKPFYLQASEVSQAQYKAVMGENPSSFKSDDLPVENISWHAAALFCERLGKREKRSFRLPTEAEWEYAARAGKPGAVSGTGKLEEMAWHADNSGKQPLDSAAIWDNDADNYFERLSANGCAPRAVATGTPNDWGIHDMQGNVSEWVADWYAGDNSPADDPPGPAPSPVESRVIRGGSWGSDPRHCRVAHRDWNDPAKHSGSRGFRVVMAAD